MLDSFGRKIDYVRISVTDRCDLRCKYCMPQANPYFYDKKEILTLNNLKRISESLIKLGIKKIRITGGEPLIRKDIIEYIKFLSAKKKKKKLINYYLQLMAHNKKNIQKISKNMEKKGLTFHWIRLLMKNLIS